MIQSVRSERNDRVLQALGDPRWDFRTIAGLARELSLSEDEVAQALAQLEDQVRQAEVPDPSGRQLFTLRTKPATSLERLAKLRNFFAKSSN
jgi:hypothetical protein